MVSCIFWALWRIMCCIAADMANSLVTTNTQNHQHQQLKQQQHLQRRFQCAEVIARSEF